MMTTTDTKEQKTPSGGEAPKEARATADKRPGGMRSGGRKPMRGRRQRVTPEYEQKILNIRRVTRVMAGGRRFSFSVTIVIGNKNGLVGVGVGKANDTSLAIQKAYNSAVKNLIKINWTENRSIPHETEAKYSTARVTLMPNTGRGLVAGSGMRTVLELAGMTEVTARIHSRSKNQLNIARATIKALAPFSQPFKKEAKKKTSQNEASGDKS